MRRKMVTMFKPHKKNRENKDTKKALGSNSKEKINGKTQNKMLHSGIGRWQEQSRKFARNQKIIIMGRKKTLNLTNKNNVRRRRTQFQWAR
jgi:hypothetical protein